MSGNRQKKLPVMMYNWVFVSPLFEISDLVSLEKRSKDVFINDRTKTFHRKNPYFNILHLISIIMGGSLPKFQDT